VVAVIDESLSVVPFLINCVMGAVGFTTATHEQSSVSNVAFIATIESLQSSEIMVPSITQVAFCTHSIRRCVRGRFTDCDDSGIGVDSRRSRA